MRERVVDITVSLVLGNRERRHEEPHAEHNDPWEEEKLETSTWRNSRHQGKVEVLGWG